ncbi:hypothetical protein BsWGS_07876 [Bradybaena similaris]
MIAAHVMDTRLDQKWTWSRLVPVLVILFMDIFYTDGKVCVKREELGDRDGNLYNCDNPSLSECCERNKTFTCCQSTVVAIWNDQVWLLLAIVILAILMCLVVSWCYGQSEFFRSPTAKDAARNWRDKFVNTFTFRDHKSVNEVASLGSRPLMSSDQLQDSPHHLRLS